METKKRVSVFLFAFAGLCCVAIIAIMVVYRDDFRSAGNISPNTQTTASAQIQYEEIDLQAMLDELDANAMRAEEKYQDKYIEVTGEIRNFDSDGKYISIAPYGAGILSDRFMCYLTDPTHKAFLLEKNVGDVVTIRGKVVSIGEVLGYHIDIIEISD